MKTNWSDILYRYLEKVILFSIISIPFSFAYYSSAHWFRGITNQSQMFAIMASLYSAMVLLKMMNGNRNKSQYFIIIIILVLTYFSGSRTGMLATSICLLYAYYVEVIKNKNITLLFLSIIVGLLIFIFFSNSILEIIKDFMIKGDNNTATDITMGTITASREGQFTLFLEKMNTNKWFGTGFMVPYIKNMIQDWSFSFGLIVENGNILYSVLGDIGIIGFILFSITYGYMFCVGEKRNGNFILFLAPFVVCMGEMIFFSTNNNAIFIYMMLSIFIVKKQIV
ncbi:O-antigen ligase family protein [Thomasclavelia spiroformis]|uniref:O-antigen ligase family protein n=1 Tax=Thomasclavelia spiroformis TaxID=29348 RepID=UPI00399BAB9F